ncbi:hypothetical protein Q0F98_39190 [Paenibacillus amylolyticus]|nr:hypothetical protein Q0F98_39190 [Paenibacillus amylolyticus]
MFDGVGIENGYYTMKLNGAAAGQFYVQDNEGVAMFQMGSVQRAELIIEKSAGGENEAPQITVELATQHSQALIPFMLNGIVTDDGAPKGTLSYQWEVVSAPGRRHANLYSPKSKYYTGYGYQSRLIYS